MIAALPANLAGRWLQSSRSSPGQAPMQEISPQAFSVLESQQEAAFIAKLAAVLRDAVASLAGEPEPAFSAQVRLLVQRARSYALESEQAIGSFAVTAGLLGVDFVDQFPAARQILEGHEDQERKTELLENFTLALFEALES